LTPVPSIQGRLPLPRGIQPRWTRACRTEVRRTSGRRSRGAPPSTPPALWREVALLGVLWLLYTAVRSFVPNDLTAAVRRGQDLLALEQAWFGAPVAQLNAALVALPGLAVTANYFYATLHYLLTPAVLVWLHRRHGGVYRSARAVLLVATVIALVLFWLFPTAPPRLLPAGFVDTMATWSSYGWWSDAASAPRGLTSLSNQLAAMPSMHVGWAVWVGWQLWRRGEGPLLRVVGVAYPSLTTLVVVATANHYVVDALAGAAVVAAAALVVHWRPRELTGGRSEVLC